MFYIGLDLGTSGLKGLLVDGKGKIVKKACSEYAVSYPRDGWAEQNPADWLEAALRVIKELSAGIENEVAGLSAGGQMHGLVMLDSDDKVIRPAILWNDGRAQPQADYLNNTFGREKLSRLTANIAYAGFTAPKILWVKQNEPQNFGKIAKIMLPKDYLSYMLTGVFCTDFSDAGGTLLLDVKNKRWSEEMCRECSVKISQLPELFESFHKVGKIKTEILPNAVLYAGAGDNAAAAVGTGAVEDGDCNISLGTSGTVFIARDSFSEIKDNALHNFVHATGKWHYLGCILSAAGANKWWIEKILASEDYDGEVKGAENLLGKNTVYFLPYLMGERSPHNDASARGAFLGMNANTARKQMNLAVLEGVAFALRDCVEAAKACGVGIKRATICGGGAASRLWKKIIANVLGVEVCSPEYEEGAAYGAALIAMYGSGEIANFGDIKKLVPFKDIIKPSDTLSEDYERRYAVYKTLYPALKDVFGRL